MTATKQLKPGMRVADTFCELDAEGKIIGGRRVEGTFIKFELGFCYVRYNASDLPQRCQRKVEEGGTVILAHDDSPDEILD